VHAAIKNECCAHGIKSVTLSLSPPFRSVWLILHTPFAYASTSALHCIQYIMQQKIKKRRDTVIDRVQCNHAGGLCVRGCVWVCFFGTTSGTGKSYHAAHIFHPPKHSLRLLIVTIIFKKTNTELWTYFQNGNIWVRVSRRVTACVSMYARIFCVSPY